ncbi:hypothetical protein ACH4JZ_18340 [Streptomyces sp. NPDC017615]|uniref:hypothetical protein n=1 Tax=Streptomyces sp. NPDC017615 TaxID=3365003 RepID=UPI0037883389
MSRAPIRWNGPAVLAALRTAEVRGVRLGGEHLLQVANTRVPIEEGTLERSGTVTVDEGDRAAVVSYDSPYAVRQHEELNYRHDAGREAKWLEKSLHQENGAITEIIAAEVRRAIR